MQEQCVPRWKSVVSCINNAAPKPRPEVIQVDLGGAFSVQVKSIVIKCLNVPNILLRP